MILAESPQIHEGLFLTYDIVRRVPTCTIKLEHHFSSGTIAD